MNMRMLCSIAISLAAVASASANAADGVPIRFENRGLPVVVKQFRDGVQCDLSQLGRGHYAIGSDPRVNTRRHFDRVLAAGEPVEFVFVRKAFRPARVGVPILDARGVRTRLVPQAGLEYRVRVAEHATQMDAIIESRPLGSQVAFERVPALVSFEPQDLCVTGVRGQYAAR
jgi:hypothetical protein